MVLISLYQMGYLFLLGFSFLFLGVGVSFLLGSNVIIIEWMILNLNTSTVSYTIILDWMALMFVGVVVLFPILLFFMDSIMWLVIFT